jgi:hypothetical protein
MTVVYSLTAIWGVVAVILMLWDGYLAVQMENYRIPGTPRLKGRGFSFQTDPAHFTEIGHAYRRRSVRVELALLVWGPIIPIALGISSGM